LRGKVKFEPRGVHDIAAARDQILLVTIEGFGERFRSAAATAARESTGLIASLPKSEDMLAIGLLEVVGGARERLFPILAPTVSDLNDPLPRPSIAAVFEG
jgi:hypothetical protein